VRGAAGRRAFIRIPPQKKISQNCSACATQVFQIIIAALFVPPPFAHCKINPQKQGQKSTDTQKGKTWYLSEKVKNLSIPKRHRNSGASTAHVLPIIQK
jgi:hypothetical protein